MARLDDAPRCPYCARVRIVLAEKGIPHDVVVVDLDDRPAWIIEKNPPAGRVPVWEEEGLCLPESEVIMEYLEERFPEPALLPADPAERALARLAIFRFEERFGDDYYAMRREEPGAREHLQGRLAELDAQLAARPFLGGGAFGLADIAYVPWVLRCRDRFGISLGPWPALEAWVDTVCERPSVAPEITLAAGHPLTVVYLHALPLDERMWEGFHGVAPRLYGRGRSMDEWAESLLAELEGDLVLVGSSMGGYCALAMARLAPERIRGLALVGSRPEADSPERLEFRAAVIERIKAEGAVGLWAGMRPSLMPADVDPTVLQQARSMAIEQQPDELVAAVEAIRDRADSTGVWHSLTVPKMLIAGGADPFLPVADARVIAAPAEPHVLEGCGHFPALERPVECSALIEAFVARCR